MHKPVPKLAQQALHKTLSVSDARGIARLLTDATLEVNDIVEGVHQSVWGTLGVPGGQEEGTTRGITGLVYSSSKTITRLVGSGIEAIISSVEYLADSTDKNHPESPQRQAIVSALNGVLGDYLVSTDNPLATPMTLRYQGSDLDWEALPPMPDAGGKIMLLVHGLCMNDLQWQASAGKAEGHGDSLAALGYTPVYLRYNTGLSVTRNARDLSLQLVQLAAKWPVPIEELSILAHSMGGLVARGAVHHATENNAGWQNLLKNIVFLGTPHHGAPLERAGALAELALGKTPYTAPFTALGRLRSEGICDLRFGYSGQDWPLPEKTSCYTIAATTSQNPGAHTDNLAGDGLVPINSALGKHVDPDKSLRFTPDQQWVAYGTSHIELLSCPEVTGMIAHCLSPA